MIPHLERADFILHAGDLMDPRLLEELAARSGLPETLEFEFGGTRVAMTHDSGTKRGRRSRMRWRFPEARVIVFELSQCASLRLSAISQSQ